MNTINRHSDTPEVVDFAKQFKPAARVEVVGTWVWLEFQTKPDPANSAKPVALDYAVLSQREGITTRCQAYYALNALLNRLPKKE